MISYEITCFINYKYIDRKVYVLRFKIPFYKREGSEFINECKYMREKNRNNSMFAGGNRCLQSFFSF